MPPEPATRAGRPDPAGHAAAAGAAAKVRIPVLSDEVCARLVSRQDAFEAVEAVFAAAAAGAARNFPVVREAIGYGEALYGFKSGFDRSRLVLGVKSGGYWPGNSDRGLARHQSTVFLFDADTGQLKALVAGNHLTAIRTGAASAVSIAQLARKNARVLGIVGAGHQAPFQLRAAAEQRDFERVVAWSPHRRTLPELAQVAEEAGLPFEAVGAEELAARADVIVTITSSFAPLLKADWIRPGTHLACMGTDTRGKQEVEPALLAAAVFTDEIAQSVAIGEAQHAFAAGTIAESAITPLGAVIDGTHPGRTSDAEITLFDGTGVGLQDLAVADLALRRSAGQGGIAFVEL
ncbi:MAG: ornithine cyclodeaminase family protein [Rhodospirillaceae bacterium]|nr:ornithine cyclodeaminase family protein [Rhodospirillaceae bacterium]MYF86792.1 ornithine cyclodeaminase family protein [Rhodospirillaceae bacterium]MYH35754.1 ornithine cyclodeaminase family protein [Rhodospirillaceae bacterium]MYK14237.1 ornithine cyclodeaminase family protein [Rhodospirillaceae bacterium]